MVRARRSARRSAAPTNRAPKQRSTTRRRRKKAHGKRSEESKAGVSTTAARRKPVNVTNEENSNAEGRGKRKLHFQLRRARRRAETRGAETRGAETRRAGLPPRGVAVAGAASAVVGRPAAGGARARGEVGRRRERYFVLAHALLVLGLFFWRGGVFAGSSFRGAERAEGSREGFGSAEWVGIARGRTERAEL